MGNSLSGKTAVVTGAGKRSGIGYAAASKLAAEGANIVIADLGPDVDPELAVKTGIWPLKEYIDGQVVHTKAPK